MAARKTVAIGIFGNILDAGDDRNRFARWRPTVALCLQPSFPVDRLELICQPKFSEMAGRLAADIAEMGSKTAVNLAKLDFADPWDFEEVYGVLHDFAVDYPFDTANEDYVVHISTGTHVQQICLFLLAEARYIPGKLVQTVPPARGGGDKSIGTHAVIDLDLSRYDRIASRFRMESVESTSYLKCGIETRNARFNEMIDEIERVSVRSKSPILLLGPTGSGKSKLARRIFELKKMRHLVAGPFVEVNCSTLRGDHAMSSLFGHVRGAFTGAVKDRPGLLRAADNGVLFLDEIGDLGPDEQAMLLRALEEGRFLPMGSDREAESRFSLIAGTNKDLRRAVSEGRFRNDLLARINVWSFRLPGLSERPEDIEPNLDFEIRLFAEKSGRRIRFNREAREKFLSFATSPATPWLGNFRDLNGMVGRMATLAESGIVTVGVVESEIARVRAEWGVFQPRPKRDIGLILRGAEQSLAVSRGEEPPREFLSRIMDAESLSSIDQFELAALAEAVRTCRASRSLSEAGRALYAASRLRRSSVNDADRLRKYLARFGLDWESVNKEP